MYGGVVEYGCKKSEMRLRSEYPDSVAYADEGDGGPVRGTETECKGDKEGLLAYKAEMETVCGMVRKPADTSDVV